MKVAMNVCKLIVTIWFFFLELANSKYNQIIVLIYVLHNVLLYFGEKIKVDFFFITSIRILPHSDEVED